MSRLFILVAINTAVAAYLIWATGRQDVSPHTAFCLYVGVCLPSAIYLWATREEEGDF